jgi:hypothetical protein
MPHIQKPPPSETDPDAPELPWGIPWGEDAGNLKSNSSAENAFLSVYGIPADVLTPGSIIVVRAFGVYGTTGSAPTITLKLKIGTVTVLTSPAITLGTNLTAKGWELYAQAIVQGQGPTADVDVQGCATFNGTATSIGDDTASQIDTTAACPISITEQFSAAHADNSIKLRQLCVWVYTP